MLQGRLLATEAVQERPDFHGMSTGDPAEVSPRDWRGQAAIIGKRQRTPIQTAAGPNKNVTGEGNQIPSPFKGTHDPPTESKETDPDRCPDGAPENQFHE